MSVGRLIPRNELRRLADCGVPLDFGVPVGVGNLNVLSFCRPAALIVLPLTADANDKLLLVPSPPPLGLMGPFSLSAGDPLDILKI